MSRILPYPFLAAMVFGMWVLLTGFSPGHVVLAALVALIVPRVMRTIWPQPRRVRVGWAMARLFGLVVADIARSNLAVARIVLFNPPRRSGFVNIPIELRNPNALAMLAIIITATPGTLWVQHDARNHFILLHVLDLVEESDWTRLIKGRYEQLLMEIFE